MIIGGGRREHFDTMLLGTLPLPFSEPYLSDITFADYIYNEA